jgi:hypothetical protein
MTRPVGVLLRAPPEHSSHAPRRPDVTEELRHAEALSEHEILRQGLHQKQDSNADTGMTVGVKWHYLRDVRDGLLALDAMDTPVVSCNT